MRLRNSSRSWRQTGRLRLPEPSSSSMAEPFQRYERTTRNYVSLRHLGGIWASGERALQRKQRRQNMVDHIILTVSDFERSVAFYAKALKPLGITNFIDYEGQAGHPDLKGFGDGKRAFFWLK